MKSMDNSQRRYMEALRVMASTKGPFAFTTLRATHRISDVRGILKKLGWLNVMHGRKSSWTGPIPKTEEDLFRMATIVRQANTDHNVSARKAKQAKAIATVMPKKPAMAVPVRSPLPSTPVKRREKSLSILWGLVKITL